MEILTNAFAFIVVLGVMIFFHEFGHFITAKMFGMRVFIFSFGFGTRLVGFKWGDTDCRISLVPLGGYVKLEGETDDKLSEDVSELGDGKDFAARPRWQRFLVYLAGPAMNGVLTIGVMTALYMIGMYVPGSMLAEPVVGSVVEGSAAEQAGIRSGEQIVAIDGQPVATWEDAHTAILLRPGQKARLELLGPGGARREVTLQVETTGDRVGTIGVLPPVKIGIPENLQDRPAARAGLRTGDAIVAVDGKPVKMFEDIPPIIGEAKDRPVTITILRDGQRRDMVVQPKDEGQGPKVGIGDWFVLRRYGFATAFGESLRWTWKNVTVTVDVLRRLLTAQLSPKTMMGPVGIAQASGDAARGGLDRLALLVAIISLQIGMLNLFPLPPLDGGHLAIIASEGLLRRDFSQDVKIWIMNAGALVLFLLIGLVLYSDLSKTSMLGRYLP